MGQGAKLTTTKMRKTRSIIIPMVVVFLSVQSPSGWIQPLYFYRISAAIFRLKGRQTQCSHRHMGLEIYCFKDDNAKVSPPMLVTSIGEDDHFKWLVCLFAFNFG